MKLPAFILALLIGTLAFAYGAWYSFTFVAPALAWGIIAAYILILIYLPYNNITKRK